ncbi:virulence associated lipoprotein [Borrelia duttonii]|uniref:virulence associated lipoprotein n=1 Tax=Borrelia duttonii TaxID=40834 RepID=UPI0004B6DB77|nr:virulence associated lipoprotein [Borrelia duttonii]
MKQKVFIIFMLISLISLLLIACGQNGKTSVDSAKVQRKLEGERREDLIIAPPEEVQGKSEEEERQERIATIKNNGIPSEVIKILEEHHKGPFIWKGDFYDYIHNTSIYSYGYTFGSIDKVFKKVPYKNGVDDNGKELVYGTVVDRDSSDDIDAVREEVYLAFGYSSGFARAFGELASKLVETPALLTKNKVKLKDFLIKIRKCAKSYYVDAYDTLQKKLGNLESLSASDVKSLHDNVDLLKTERDKLVSKILQPLKDKYPIIGECLADPGSKTIVNTLTADEIETYWNTLSAKFDSICNEIIKISGEIKGILNRLKVKY